MDNITTLFNEWQNLQPIDEQAQRRLDDKFMLEFNYNSNHIEGNTLTYGQTELLFKFGDVAAPAKMRDLEEMKAVFRTFFYELLGMKAESDENRKAREEAYGKVVDMVLERRRQAKADKDWATSDKIRNDLTAWGFEIKDTKDGFTWKLNK